MKRIFVLLLMSVSLLCFVSCDSGYKTRTAEFYGSIDKTSFWFMGEIVDEGYGYVYTQAVHGNSVTAIEDHDADSLDKYVIYDGTYLHSLRLDEGKYDTLKTDKGVEFLFDRDYKDFNKAKDTVEDAVFDGKELYCEIFNLVDGNGDKIGESKYYFDGDVLVAIEWLKGEEVSITLRMAEYSNTIPENIYVSIPEGFKGGVYTDEQIVNPWEDLSR